MERLVGWFVLAAMALVVCGFAYYIRYTAAQRGWFEPKATYFTYSDTGAGLAVGDPVKLMGFPVGRITAIEASPPRGPGSDHNVRITFIVVGTNYSYIWTGSSHVSFTASLLSGTRQLDISKGTGTNNYNTYINFPVEKMSLSEIEASTHLDKLRLGQEIYTGTNRVMNAWAALSNHWQSIEKLGVSQVWVIDGMDRKKDITSVWNDLAHHYEPVDQTNSYCLTPDETPALMDHINGIVGQVEAALPRILAYTNQIVATLSNVTQISSNVNAELVKLNPILSNVDYITASLRDTNGSLGNMLIPPVLKEQIVGTLSGTRATMTNVNITLDDVNTRLPSVLEGVDLVLSNTANITSNLNNQVVANSNMLTAISDMVIHSDSLVEGLKHHWLLRSAFKPAKTNAPPVKTK
jgi:uncharacterized protein YoxC